MEKRYNYREYEPSARALWEKEKTYSPHNHDGQPYSIDTPPPTVSGNLHIGHIFSYTQTDIIARYKRMSGYKVFYPFGFDDNGLPTEKYVEKKCKVSAHKIGRSAFIQECLTQTQEVEEQFKKVWQNIGLSVDWDAWYSTISEDSRKISQESFIRLYKAGHIYRKEDPALYCTACRTSVAQAELDDLEKPSQFNDIVFSDAKGNDLIIGTTRPELLPACVAVFYNPADERYQHLKNTTARVPLFDYEVPILEDEQVAIEKGTGLVMCCTFGDKTDIHWYKTFKLPYRQAIGPDGKFTELCDFLAGLKVPAAREAVLEALKNKNLVLHQRDISHTVNVHERCKKPIEFVMLSQWFLHIVKDKQQYIALADQIEWYPKHMKARYTNWVENIGWDWCLSRQRFYGIPFPVWHCNACDEILLAEIDQLPIDPQETPFPGNACAKCGSDDITPDTDVMDTWNTSSLTPYICKNIYQKSHSVFTDNSFIPMSVRPQAHDIIRTWAFYTIIKSWLHNKTVPWKQIVISGHVLAGDKEKLSKSRGNAGRTPEQLIEQYSADVIRYWTASGGLGNDIAFSETQLKIGQKLVTKIWNAFRFIKDHVGVDRYESKPTELGIINEWLLDSISARFKSYKKYLEKNEFSLALDKAEQFFWNDFCDNYLELVKHQLFNPESYTSQQVYATKWTLYHVGLRILQLYAPYLSYVTETIYGELYAEREGIYSLHQTKFVHAQEEFVCTKSVQRAGAILDIVGQVRKLKTEHRLSLGAPLQELILYSGDADIVETLKLQTQVLMGVTRAEKITFVQKGDMPSCFEQKGDAWIANIGSGINP